VAKAEGKLAGTPGQASVEFLSCMGLLMLAVASVAAYSYDGWDAQRRLAMAETTVRDLRIVAERVYSAGQGSRQTITILVPEGARGTNVGDGIIGISLDLPGGLSTEVSEATKVPVRGHVPSAGGTHLVSVQHSSGGFVVIGRGLSVEPSIIAVEAAQGEAMNFSMTVSNLGDTPYESVGISFDGGTAGWSSANESGFELSQGEAMALDLRINVPADASPGTYAGRMSAEASDDFAEASVYVTVKGTAPSPACSPGQVRECGLGDCGGGVSICVESAGVFAWGGCSTFGRHCGTQKCCICGATAADPAPIYNGSADMSFRDCVGTGSSCSDPNTCSGWTYGFECSSLDGCAPDTDQSLHPLSPSPGACEGRVCAPEERVCSDQSYPCHGSKTAHKCDKSGGCGEYPEEDASACLTLPSCGPLPTGILHKLDVNEWDDYVDADRSLRTYPGVYDSWPSPCLESSYSTDTFTEMYYTEPGAYAPYQNGTMSVYGKARHRADTWGRTEECNLFTEGRTGYCRPSVIKLGTDERNYNAYPAPALRRNWQRFTIDLKKPLEKVGSVDWGDIRFLEVRYVGVNECRSSGDPGCGECVLWLDYVTLQE
jgi:hypothetical protein